MIFYKKFNFYKTPCGGLHKNSNMISEKSLTMSALRKNITTLYTLIFAIAWSATAFTLSRYLALKK